MIEDRSGGSLCYWKKL